jgi:pilus assembly protein CpaC
MSSEVSSIDPSLSVNTGTISIPGLKVRRAKTTIELKDGQSFSIAGLLQDDFQDGVSQLPGLGSIPILGALFRSTNFRSKVRRANRAHDHHPPCRSSVRGVSHARHLAVVLPSPGALFGEGKTEQSANGGAAMQGSTNGFVLP